MSGKIVAGVIQHPDSSDPNLVLNDDGTVDLFGGDGLGDVVGPVSSTDNALVRFDGTTGTVVQNSGITVDDNGKVTTDLTVSKASALLEVTGTGGTHPVVRITGDAGTNRSVFFYTGSNDRWCFRADNTAESGSDAGSNFVILNTLDSGAGGGTPFKITRATGKTTLGSVGASAGLELGASGPRVMSGTGSPEGVVTAPVGSRWIRTDGDTLGDFEYQKRSGTGSTGWVVADGDTGWRDLTADLTADANRTLGSAILLRRVGCQVSFMGTWLETGTPSNKAFYTLTTGFKPPLPLLQRVDYTPDTTSAYRILRASSSGAMTYGGPSNGSHFEYSMTWTTSEAWPSSLPGVAA